MFETTLIYGYLKHSETLKTTPWHPMATKAMPRTVPGTDDAHEAVPERSREPRKSRTAGRAGRKGPCELREFEEELDGFRNNESEIWMCSS